MSEKKDISKLVKIVINKIDLDNKLTIPDINKNIIKISIKDNIGIENLKEEIKRMV